MTDRFTRAQVDTAIDFVVRAGAEDRGQTIAYTRVFEAAGMPAPRELHGGGEHQVVSQFMEAFHWRCVERDLPPLDALVVQVAGERQGMPGSGYFRVNNQPDPITERREEAVVAGTNFWLGQKHECETWGTAHRRGRIPRVTDA